MDAFDHAADRVAAVINWNDQRKVLCHSGFSSFNYHLAADDRKKTPKVIENLLAETLQFAVSLPKDFSSADILVTGGLGFIGSPLARRLLARDAKVTLVDSLIPEYGGNLFNINDIRDRVAVELADVRDASAMADSIEGAELFF